MRHSALARAIPQLVQRVIEGTYEKQLVTQTEGVTNDRVTSRPRVTVRFWPVSDHQTSGTIRPEAVICAFYQRLQRAGPAPTPDSRLVSATPGDP